jgi:phosphoribosylformylglycinamidine synthase
MKNVAGIAALSDIRRQNLLKQLQALDHGITAVDAEYVHFVDGGATPGDDAQLKKLLTYGLAYTGQTTGELFLVTPRPGTISPWSSKATDIARNAGLKNVARIERGTAYYIQAAGKLHRQNVGEVLHDRMVESVLDSLDSAKQLFVASTPKPFATIDILAGGKDTLAKANKELGTAMDDGEIGYLVDAFTEIGRNPTDVEIMTFGAVNSEHTRHKIFNADWIVDGKKQPKGLFNMIRNTYEQKSDDILSAYSDNAAVLRGQEGGRFFAEPKTGVYTYHQEPIHSIIKVETHNHPTAIAPFPGAATGTGGEIRDEGATGRGGKPKIGLSGYTVSNLNIPGSEQPWEKPYGKPDRIVSALDVMIEAPLGAASFGNEFGRPNVTGYFRTYEQESEGQMRGYHKPIMIAGGLGNIRDGHVLKNTLPTGAKVIVLGGPAMLIGLGGGAASSMQTGSSSADLDFASVQRGNGEMERRCQEVIDTCWAMGDDNPIITIHDIGAGGYSNALSEFVHDSDMGGLFKLRDIPNADMGMTPLEIWCNEAQERYVIGLTDENLALFTEICERERCLFAVVGVATKKRQLVVHDALFDNNPIDMPMEALFGKPPKMTREVTRRTVPKTALDLTNIDIAEAVKRVLHLPAVGSKKFLITIGDRTVGGLTMRDQMVGPWQVPVADVAVSAAAFDSKFGEAMAMGERTPLALIDSPASARIAIGETITNMLASDIEKLSDIKLSANWMAAASDAVENQNLYDTVKMVGEEFCPDLGLTIPVGKDSLSMRTVWEDGGAQKSVMSPLSLIITGFSPVTDVRRTLTPQLNTTDGTSLILIDLGKGANRLGGSALAQVFNQVGDTAPDVDPAVLKKFFITLTKLKAEGKVLAYHDRSDGGLFTALAEMAFASRSCLAINVSQMPGTTIEKLFNEELGAVIQVRKTDEAAVLAALDDAYIVGQPTSGQTITVKDGESVAYENTRAQLESWWAATSYQIQKLRDNPEAAEQEYKAISDEGDWGISPVVTFKPAINKYDSRPKVAIFREQGVNGQIEMAAAFDKAGFTSVDVHLNDLMNGKVNLDGFAGLVACGGFSYGDVLGAGEGWAKTILFHDDLRAKFKQFFERPDTFSFGVCNGCQMLSALKELIPGAENWPTFLKNTSEQFEARLVSVRVNESPSILFKGMAGSILPVSVAHGEGRVKFTDSDTIAQARADGLVAMQYVDNQGEVTEQYPLNPNGSEFGITSLTTPDGRATITMPHPERAFMTRQLSWYPADWDEDSPWFQLFQNARQWVDSQK